MNKWSVRCLQLPTAVLKFHYGCAKGFRHGVTRFESQLWNTVKDDSSLKWMVISRYISYSKRL